MGGSAQIVAAASPKRVLLQELLLGTNASAGEEYIRLVNTSDSTVVLDGWQLQYAPASAVDWSKPSRSIALSGAVASHATFLLATSNYNAEVPRQIYASTLSQTGGHVRLVAPEAGVLVQQDSVAWGTALPFDGQPISAPKSGEVLKRRTNPDGSFMSSGSSAADFEVASLSPFALPAGNTSDSQSSGLQISELLPNPGPPRTDAADEFIELYNGGNTTIDLTGYTITTGMNNTYKYTIKNGALAPGGYIAFYAKDTKLALSNSGGKASLLSPQGTVIDQTPPYGAAANDQSWIADGDHWVWTMQASPGAPNTLVIPEDKTAVAASSKSAPAKSKQAAAAKTKKTKSRAVAVKSSKQGSKPAAASQNDPAAAKASPLHPVMLAAVGGGAVLYACYEYRHDLANRIAQLRSNRTARRTAG